MYNENDQNNENNSFIMPPMQEDDNQQDPMVQPVTPIDDNPVDEFEPTLEDKTKSFLPNFDIDAYERKNNFENDDTVKPESTISNLISNNSTNYYNSGPKVYAVEKPKTNVPIVVALTVIILLVAGYLVYMFMDTMTKKMVCESNTGNISITYNKTTIVGYRSNNITYDIYEQRTYADEIGIKQYLDEFENWFKTTTNGSCKR